MAQPALYILAGPNGSGKTTFALNDPTLRNIEERLRQFEANQK